MVLWSWASDSHCCSTLWKLLFSFFPFNPLLNQCLGAREVIFQNKRYSAIGCRPIRKNSVSALTLPTRLCRRWPRRPFSICRLCHRPLHQTWPGSPRENVQNHRSMALSIERSSHSTWNCGGNLVLSFIPTSSPPIAPPVLLLLQAALSAKNFQYFSKISVFGHLTCWGPNGFRWFLGLIQ